MTIRVGRDYPVRRMRDEEPDLSCDITEVVRMLAHDLRQPVATIRALAAPAAPDGDAGAPVLRGLAQISDQANWFSAAIDGTRGWLETERPPGGPGLVRLNLPVARVLQQAAGAECA